MKSRRTKAHRVIRETTGWRVAKPTRTLRDQYRAARREAERSRRAMVREALAGQDAVRMISEAVYELFGPIASLESETGTFWRGGPELHHRAEAIIEALQRVAERMDRIEESRGQHPSV